MQTKLGSDTAKHPGIVFQPLEDAIRHRAVDLPRGVVTCVDRLVVPRWNRSDRSLADRESNAISRTLICRQLDEHIYVR